MLCLALVLAWSVTVQPFRVSAPAPRLRRSARRMSEQDGAVDDADEAARIAAFRARLMKGGLDEVAKVDEPEESEGPAEWARPADGPATGVVLVGKPDWFFAPKPDKLQAAALERCGLAPDAAERAPPERYAAISPVVLLLEGGAAKTQGYRGVLMGRRSGYMMGDFKELKVQGFMLQPLWVGGPAQADGPRRTVGAPDGETETGIVAVHPFADLPNAERVGEDGLCVGGDWRTATTLVEKGMLNPYRFRLFAQGTAWKPGELEREIQAGAWRLATVSCDLLLKDRERGAVPLGVDILDHLDDEVKSGV